MHNFDILSLDTDEPLHLLHDDFYEVEAFFRAYEHNHSTKLLPVSPTDPHLSELTSRLSPVEVPNSSLTGYRIDGSRPLKEAKAGLQHIASQALASSPDLSELSLAPSSTHAILVALLLAKRYGFERIVFEAPVYYAALELSQCLDLRVTVICKNWSTNHELTSEDIRHINELYDNYVLFLTHPKFGPCTNRCPSTTLSILNTLNNDAWMVLDEAVDREVPSRLRLPPQHPQLFRIRGPFKAFALNGVRVAYIVHDSRYRADLLDLLTMTSAQVDAFSAKLLSEFPGREDEYRMLIDQAHDIVQKNLNILSCYLSDTFAHPLPIENGYFGLIRMPLSENHDFWQQRSHLLQSAAANGLEMQFASSIYFPYDFYNEYIRYNFFIDYTMSIHIADKLRHVANVLCSP